MTKESLIDQLLKGAEEVVNIAKRPFVKAKVKSAIESAVRSAEEAKVDANIELNDLRKKLIEEPKRAEDILNQIVDKRGTIIAANDTIAALKEEQGELF